ncbi:MAG: hypothetical protein JWQ71_2433 [Pedosphaera sp.]|nr:hypothetical protein [Pedosphaera sp.]
MTKPHQGQKFPDKASSREMQAVEFDITDRPVRQDVLAVHDLSTGAVTIVHDGEERLGVASST